MKLKQKFIEWVEKKIRSSESRIISVRATDETEDITATLRDIRNIHSFSQMGVQR